MKPDAKLTDSVNANVWYVAAAMLVAILFGGVFLFFAIETAVSTVAPHGSGGASSKEAGANVGTEAVATAGTPSSTGTTATGTKPGTDTKLPTDTKSAQDAIPVGGAPSKSGATPDSKAGIQAAPSESAKPRIVETDRIRSAARWAGLLWAFACCAVGAFLGFIFGIPRSLSSDTARTTVAAQPRPSESASARASTLATREKEEAAREVERIGQQVAKAEADLQRLRADAGAGAASDPNVKTASDALAVAEESKRKAEIMLSDKSAMAQQAESVAKKEHQAQSSAATSTAFVRGEAVHTRAPSTAVNTNLEQISDWLTKIIVGVSLVNSDRIGHGMVVAAQEMAASFGGPGSRSLALALMTYFGVIGLLGGYLLTRLFLQRAFEEIASANHVE